MHYIDNTSDQDGVLIPYVVEKTAEGERSYDLFTRLLRDRIVFILGPIEERVAEAIIASLLFLEKEDPDKDIDIYINSPGGEIAASLTIYDVMQTIKPNISTTVIGQASGFAALLLCAGTKGKRYALPHSRILLHKIYGGYDHNAYASIEIAVNAFQKTQKYVSECFAKHTGQPIAKIEKDIERDFILSTQEAIQYGLIDDIFRGEQSSLEGTKEPQQEGSNATNANELKIPSNLVNKVILVSDDDKQGSAIIAQFLLQFGFHYVFFETDAIKSLELVHQLKPDLLIVDFMQPGMDGIEIIKTIRESSLNKKPKYILISGYSTDGQIKNAINDGITDAFVQLPCTAEELCKVVVECLI